MNKYFEGPWIFARDEYFSRFYITLGVLTANLRQSMHYSYQTRRENNIKCLLSSFTVRILCRAFHRPATRACKFSSVRKEQNEERQTGRAIILPFPPTYLPLDVCCFLWCGPRQDARVAEARPEKHSHHKDEQHSSDGRNGRSQVWCQEWAAGRKGMEKLAVSVMRCC